MNLKYFIKAHLETVKSAALDLWPNSILAKNKEFHNLHLNEDIYILGSGHSVRTQNLKLLSGKIVMTQNHFHAHEDILAINPKYHVLVPKYQDNEFDNSWIEWLVTMEKRLPKETLIFAGLNTKYLIDSRNLLKDRTFYLKPGYNAISLKKSRYNLTKRIMRIPTVLTECLSIAMYMGFKNIYLIGFDLDQMCRISQDRENLRFYGNSPITNNSAERNYEKEYATSGIDWFNMWTIWKQLNLISLSAKKQGSEIINLTNGGLLNIFPRGNYEKHLSK